MELRKQINDRIAQLTFKNLDSYCLLCLNQFPNIITDEIPGNCYYALNNQCGMAHLYHHFNFSNYAITKNEPFNLLENNPQFFSIDNQVFDHSVKVSELCYQLGEALDLDDNELLKLKKAAMYHDVGKNKIPQNILNKPSSLNKDEWKIMRNHAVLSYKTLLKFPQFNNIALYVKYHHERIDGKGYPEGLKGDEIPFISRIISVVDAFEAMTSDRPYKKAMTQEEAIAELIKNAGTQFDKNIVKTFINNVLENK
ncbi:HD-GYP domain-containing protein [Hujiaoplasma nucleasis]|uniref:HD-GYP domain-containing protein n=1 Tax=Hujiaoplasma nucleasis TaxID=2725268 RepID=A0A7L6N2I0_9MOLU|nr:HD-GYP domain-containing protein [Hujiaoplasma nucleasis]QLY40476.1 HD-GYP domain-containing protein [Hujiaoplasma nucleasis]